MIFFPAELAKEARTEVFLFHTEWDLGARYVLGYQFSRSSRDSVFVFLPYNATFFPTLPALASSKKSVG